LILASLIGVRLNLRVVSFFLTFIYV
jgi:hypothetical protein